MEKGKKTKQTIKKRLRNDLWQNLNISEIGCDKVACLNAFAVLVVYLGLLQTH